MPPNPPPPWVIQQRRDVGNRIRLLRAERGLSQERLAAITGLNRHTIYRAELGTHAVSVDSIALIARALDVPPDRFFRDG